MESGYDSYANYENYFIYLLTEKRSCDMIGGHGYGPVVGTRMQRRRLPLGLLSRAALPD
jgi:hypothetical protein